MPDVKTDLRIHYDRVGLGPPVVWHTGGCGDGQMWSLGGYLTGLPGFTHVAIDPRGRGRSDAPLDMSGHQMARYVADVIAVLDDAGLDAPAVPRQGERRVLTCGQHDLRRLLAAVS